MQKQKESGGTVSAAVKNMPAVCDRTAGIRGRAGQIHYTGVLR